MADNVNEIKELLSDFAAKEAELAKAELIPAAKKAGLGTGMLAISLAFVLHAVWMLIISLTTLLTWLFSLTGLSTPISIVLGFLVAFFIALAFAALFGWLGLRYFKKVKAPHGTIAEAKGLLDAIMIGLGRQQTSIMLAAEADKVEVELDRPSTSQEEPEGV